MIYLRGINTVQITSLTFLDESTPNFPNHLMQLTKRLVQSLVVQTINFFSPGKKNTNLRNFYFLPIKGPGYFDRPWAMAVGHLEKTAKSKKVL